ncbi:hypothetical protein [Parachlamydia sp. AcF125]|uniref:hypothetical protein n=1 Tax=Parachlamydia sp. AcF125 TaxID=2795736 RepID=UPI001BC8D7CD|nr:hypothetical protein [Parachlamydia sp. AcF125]MBS4167876.1 hypothetical protein [Parachlamydia sp. AcF125]
MQPPEFPVKIPEARVNSSATNAAVNSSSVQHAGHRWKRLMETIGSFFKSLFFRLAKKEASSIKRLSQQTISSYNTSPAADKATQVTQKILTPVDKFKNKALKMFKELEETEKSHVASLRRQKDILNVMLAELRGKGSLKRLPESDRKLIEQLSRHIHALLESASQARGQLHTIISPLKGDNLTLATINHAAAKLNALVDENNKIFKRKFAVTEKLLALNQEVVHLKNKKAIQQLMQKFPQGIGKDTYDFDPCIPPYQRLFHYQNLSGEIVREMEKIGMPNEALTELRTKLIEKIRQINSSLPPAP